MKKIQNSKLVIRILRILKYKHIFAKGYTPNWSEEVFVIKNVKNTVPWTYVTSDFNGEKIIEIFYENELHRIKEKEFWIEKIIKKKVDKLYVKWKGYNNPFNSWIAKPYEPFGGDIDIKMDLSNYATKGDLKNATGVDTSKFAKRFDLASLKSNIDKLDIDNLKTFPGDLSNLKIKVDKWDVNKLAPVPVDLSKLNNVVKNYVVKKDLYNVKIKIIEDKLPYSTKLLKINYLIVLT